MHPLTPPETFADVRSTHAGTTDGCLMNDGYVDMVGQPSSKLRASIVERDPESKPSDRDEFDPRFLATLTCTRSISSESRLPLSGSLGRESNTVCQPMVHRRRGRRCEQPPHHSAFLTPSL
ncbi:hypothetical protein LIA77_06503 [Sarocladium implicatum]|nr:hypothetical protein LIA77_06503 [Sarocladium implicatum]